MTICILPKYSDFVQINTQNMDNFTSVNQMISKIVVYKLHKIVEKQCIICKKYSHFKNPMVYFIYVLLFLGNDIFFRGDWYGKKRNDSYAFSRRTGK